MLLVATLAVLALGFVGVGVQVARRGLSGRRALREAAEDDAEPEPLMLGHLSGALQRFVQDTRILRASLEGPARDVGLYLDGDVALRADDHAGFDAMLMDVTRQIVEWLQTVEAFAASDQEQMAALGASSGGVQEVMRSVGGGFERRHLAVEMEPPLDARMRRIVDELERVEKALAVPAASPYRR